MQKRLHQKEQLDNFNLSGHVLHQTLTELAIINRYLGNYRALEKAIFKIVNQHQKDSFHIIDLGCGGGDMLLFLAKKFRKKNIKATFIGIDGNANSLTFAAKKSPDFIEISFQQADLLDTGFLLPKCDILISSHFLYHFDNQQVVSFLEKQKPFINLAFIASELERNRLAFLFFRTFSPLLRLSTLTRKDGLLAIQRAFTKSELNAVLNAGNFTNFSMPRRYFFRFVLTMNFHDV